MTAADEYVLTETLALAVPFRIAEVRREPAWRRQVIASRAALAVGHQGDTLVFGSKHALGYGAAQQAAHRAHGQREGPKCPVCLKGQPTFSPGEVFNELATGLACAALLPGGATFAGLHWCTAPHPGCPAGNVSPPPDGEPR